MPKDPKRNVDRYKVRGGDINEYDYSQNQEQLAEREKFDKKMLDKNRNEAVKPTKSAAKSSTKSRKKAR